MLPVDNQDPQAIVRPHEGAIFVARKVKSAAKFKLAALANVGALHDTIPGIAHFFEHLPFGKTTHFQDEQIKRYFLTNGGYVGAETGYDTTVYYGEVLKENFSNGISGIADMVCRPVFEEKRIADEAQTITTEWARGQMDQGRQRGMELLRTGFGENRSLRPVIGDPESILSITAADIDGFYRRHYVMDNLIVYMQGDIEPEKMIDRAIAEFTLPRGVYNEIETSWSLSAATSAIAAPTSVATHTSILLPSRIRGAPMKTRAAGSLCNPLLSINESGLMREARLDKRLIYGIEINGLRSSRFGLDYILFDAFASKVPEICEIVMRHISALASDPDSKLFDSLKQMTVVQQAEHLMKDDENTPKEEARDIQASGIVYARKAFAKAMADITIDDVAAYAGEHFVSGSVSVVYEGKIMPDFPDHDALMEMRLPIRTPEMGQRVVATTKPDNKNPDVA